MSENDVRELMEAEISRYLDGEMDDSEARDFESRLSSDEELAATLTKYQRTISLLRKTASRKDAVSDEFLLAFQRKIRLKTRGRYYGAGNLRVSLQTGGMLLILVILIWTSYGVMFPSGAEFTIESGSRFIHLKKSTALPEIAGFEFEKIQVDSSSANVGTMLLSESDLDAAREILLPLLVEADVAWLSGLELEGQSLRVYLLPDDIGLSLPVDSDFYLEKTQSE